MKQFIFEIKNTYIKLSTRDGEIISVESSSKEYKIENLAEVLKVAVKIDFEQFLEMFKLLNLNTAHYKMCKKILKEEKIRMEANILEIMRWIPED